MKAVCESFHLAKDSGFKVVAHMMPDLPNVGLERDIDQFIVSVALHPANLEGLCTMSCPLCSSLLLTVDYFSHKKTVHSHYRVVETVEKEGSLTAQHQIKP